MSDLEIRQRDFTNEQLQRLADSLAELVAAIKEQASTERNRIGYALLDVPTRASVVHASIEEARRNQFDGDRTEVVEIRALP